jgi:hypothetical protein
MLQGSLCIKAAYVRGFFAGVLCARRTRLQNLTEWKGGNDERIMERASADCTDRDVRAKRSKAKS